MLLVRRNTWKRVVCNVFISSLFVLIKECNGFVSSSTPLGNGGEGRTSSVDCCSRQAAPFFQLSPASRQRRPINHPFYSSPSSTTTIRNRHLWMSPQSNNNQDIKKATLTDETTWNLRMVLRGVSTVKGKKVDEIFNVRCQFLEEEGYEPPQGIVKLIDSDTSDVKAEESPSRFQLVKSRWILSEDPNDRKDGLWVWGLFKEPLYPFLLLQLQTEAIPLPNSSATGKDAKEDKDDNTVDYIKPLQLYAQLNHQRDKEKGAVLSTETTSAVPLKIRQMETVDADVFGVSKVDLYEEVNIGTISARPV